MSKQRCAICDREDWPEKLLFCETDGIWLCPRCCVVLGLADPQPRCPRCYHGLGGREALGAGRQTSPGTKQ